MKQLLFVMLFGFTCLGHEKMHLTAYRLIDEVMDGPCSVKAYVKIMRWGLDFVLPQLIAMTSSS